MRNVAVICDAVVHSVSDYDVAVLVLHWEHILHTSNLPYFTYLLKISRETHYPFWHLSFPQILHSLL